MGTNYCFNYTTLIFCFNASPFILNYVLKHHVSKFQNDACTEKLKGRFYVDNICMTSNSSERAVSLYKSHTTIAMGEVLT